MLESLEEVRTEIIQCLYLNAYLYLRKCIFKCILVVHIYWYKNYNASMHLKEQFIHIHGYTALHMPSVLPDACTHSYTVCYAQHSGGAIILVMFTVHYRSLFLLCVDVGSEESWPAIKDL